MARLDHQRRAPFFGDDAYTPSTRESYAGRYRQYERAAREANLVPLDAPTDWIERYFLGVVMRSPAEARRQLPCVAHYFRINGQGDAFPYERIAQLLRDTSEHARDPYGASLEAIPLRQRERRRARAFSGQLSQPVRDAYAQYAQAWEMFARHYAIDPLHAPINQFVGCLTVYARSHKYPTVSNYCSGLSHYFRNASVPDLTRHEKTRTFLATLSREHARTSPYRPLYSEDLRTMVLQFGNAPLDVRDRSICLLIHYGAFFSSDIRALQRTLTLQPDGIVVNIGEVPFFVGGVDDEQLDVRIWVPRWLEAAPVGPGPLFVGWGHRGSWMVTALSKAVIGRVVRDAAERAGIHVPCPALALRKGFAIRADRAVGPVLTASYMRLKHTSSLEHLISTDVGSSLVERSNGRDATMVRSLDASAI